MEFEFVNNTKRMFSLISNEMVRTYHFEVGDPLVIDRPKTLHVSGSGHYVVDICNVCYFIPHDSFLYLTWLPRVNEPHFTC